MANTWARILNIQPGRHIRISQSQYDPDTGRINTDWYGYSSGDASLGFGEKELMDKLVGDKRPQGSDFLPAAVRHYDASAGLMLFETPPGYKTISISHHAKSGVNASNLHEYTIPFPWLVYAISMDTDFKCTQLKIAYRTKPLETSGNEYMFPLLPNVFDDLTICMPGRFYERSHNSITDLIADVLRSYWGSSFNRDLNINENALEYLNFNNSLKINQSNIWDMMGSMTLEEVLSLDMLKYTGTFQVNANTTNPLMLAMYG